MENYQWSKDIFSGTCKLCCVLIPASSSKDCFPYNWTREVTAEDLFLLPHFSYLFLTFCPFAMSFFTFQKQLVFCENKLCYLLLSSEETNGFVGEMSRTIRRTGAVYSQPKKYILSKLLSAEIMGCHGSRNWFVFCSLCFWSIRACPWGWKGQPGHRCANSLLFGGRRGEKWQMDVYCMFWMQCLSFILKRIYLCYEPRGKQQI